MSSALSDLTRRAGSLAAQIGRGILHEKFPDDFEMYMCGLEIVDANDSNNVLDYIQFPILPDNIRIADSKIQNVTKTSNGVVVLENMSFVPKVITISGNFGRRFKLVAAGGETFPNALTSDKVADFAEDNTGKKLKLPEFSLIAKNGYGMTKVLEKMFNKSSSIRDGSPVQMFFYCQAFNMNYLVQPINIQFSQNRQSTNMIWEYTMTMKAIAPADEIIEPEEDGKTLNDYLKEAAIKKGAQLAGGFVANQAKKASSKLQFKVGRAVGLN